MIDDIPARAGGGAEPHELRIFVSSTFRDMFSERDHLTKRIFPELRHLCRMRGGELTEIDLRWGIAEQSGPRGKIIGACLDAISSRCPYFIGIIGERYGWIPSEADIRDESLLRRYPWLKTAIAEQRSLIDIEITHGVLNNPLMKGRAMFYFRNPAVAAGALDHEDDSVRERLLDLKKRIRESGFPVRESFSDAATLGHWVRGDFTNIIDATFPQPDIVSTIEQDRRAHEAFAATRSRAYVPVPEYLARLEAHVQDDALPPLVITGDSGAGKSALLAFWSGRYRRDNLGTFIITYYVGAANAAGDHISLLRRIMAEIKDRYGIPDDIPMTAAEVESAFPFWLAHVQRETLVLVIDALNQLPERSHDLHWLPDYIQPNVRLIVSALDGEVLGNLRDRDWPELEVLPLTLDQRRDVVRKFLGDYGKEFTREQLHRVSGDDTSANPLFLRTRLEELRINGQHDNLNEQIEYYLEPRSLDEMFQRVLERLEGDYGKRMVRELMVMVWASRNGLTRAELLALTKTRPEELDPLLRELDYHLMQQEGRRKFFHDHLRKAVENQYVARPGGYSRRRAHLKLANYFGALPLSSRRVEEQPWQLMRAGAWEELKNCIVDIPTFLELYNDERKYELMGYWLVIGERWDIEEEYRQGIIAAGNGDASADVIDRALNALGKFLFEGANYSSSAHFYDKALESRKHIHGDHHPATAETLNDFGNLLTTIGEYERAKIVLEKALLIQETEFGNDHINVAEVLNSLATLLYIVRDYVGAEPLFRRAVMIRESVLGIRHPATLDAYTNLGAVLQAKGNPNGAEVLFQRVSEMNEQVFGAEHPSTATGLNNMATLYRDSEHAENAIALLQRALDINIRALGPAHPEIANNLMNLGFFQKVLERYDEAESSYRRALEVNGKTLGEHHADYARNLTSLGTLLIVRGNPGEAKQSFMKALSIRTMIFGDDHLETYECHLNIAITIAAHGEYAEAVALFERYFPKKQRILGEGHPDTQRSLRRFNEVLSAAALAV